MGSHSESVDRQNSQMNSISAEEIRVGDIIRPAAFGHDGNPNEPSEPVWSTEFQHISDAPLYSLHKYKEFDEPLETTFLVLQEVPPVWCELLDEPTHDSEFDRKFLVVCDKGVVLMWAYKYEMFEIISRDE